MSSSEPIKLKNLKIEFDGNRIFQRFSMIIEQGEFVGIFGPNGAGKTTLLRAILGLITPKSGTLFVCGRPAERGNPDIGYLPQKQRDLETFPLSGRTLLQATAAGMGWGIPFLDHSKKHQIKDVIELIQLEDIIDRPYAKLSGGERQRLTLACALLGNPKILLLDEPLSNLDPHQNEKIIDIITHLNKQLHITVLITAHQHKPLIKRLDRLICIGHGEAIVADPREAPEIFKKLYEPKGHVDKCP